MNFRDLEVFVKVATLGGFNRAAAQLHIAQSALSRRLSNLEHEVDTRLLIRTKKGVQLTPAGKILFERAQHLLRHCEQVQAEMLSISGEPHGELAIGFPPSLLNGTSTLLTTLKMRFPKLFVRSWVATSVELRAMLLSGKIDIAIYATGENESVLETQKLFSDPLYLIGPKGFPEINGNDWAQIAQVPLILTSQPNSVRLLVDAMAVRQNVKLKVALEVNDIPLILRLAADGVGYSILPSSAMSLNPAPLTQALIPELRLSWVIAYSKEKPMPISAEKTIEIIHEVFGKNQK